MTGITYSDGGSARAIGAVTYQDGSTKRTIQNIWIGDGGTNRLVYSAPPAVSATASPTSVNGSTPTSGQSISTNATTARLTGATATGYSWTRVSGDTSITINDPTSSVTGFTGAPTKLNPTLTAAFHCTITYSGGSAVTNTVSATLNYTGV